MHWASLFLIHKLERGVIKINLRFIFLVLAKVDVLNPVDEERMEFVKDVRSSLSEENLISQVSLINSTMQIMDLY